MPSEYKQGEPHALRCSVRRDSELLMRRGVADDAVSTADVSNA